MANLDNIYISEQVLNDIEEQVQNRTTQELLNIGDNANLLLKKIAADFIKVLQKNLKNIKEFQDNAKKLKTKRNELGLGKNPKDKKTVQAYQKYKEKIKAKSVSEYAFEDFFNAAMTFNHKILQVISGHETQMVIIVPSAEGEPPFIASIPLEEIYKKNNGIEIIGDITSGKTPKLAGRLKYNIDQMKTYFGDALRQDTILDSITLDKLNQVYNIAILDYRKWKPYAFWYIPPQKDWWKIKIGGAEGDISEAYAYFFYTGGQGGKTEKLFSGTLYRKNLDEFFREGVAQVDNVSGLYTSDISTDKYDYAIKSLDASLPGFSQMIDLAMNILNGKIKTRQQLQTLSYNKQYKKYNDQVVRKGLRNIISKSSEQEFKKYQKQKIKIKIS